MNFQGKGALTITLASLAFTSYQMALRLEKERQKFSALDCNQGLDEVAQKILYLSSAIFFTLSCYIGFKAASSV